MIRINSHPQLPQKTASFSPRIFLWGAVFMLGIFLAVPAANAANELNSLNYFIGSNSSSVGANNAVEDDANTTGIKNFTFFVGDEASLVKGLFFEISGVSANASGNNRIDVSVDDNSFSAGREKRFTINANGRQTPFKFLYDDSTDYIDGHIANTGRGTYGPYTLNIKALDAAVSLWSVRMVVIYKHTTPSSSATYELNSLNYFIGSNSSSVGANNAVEDDANTTGIKNFTFFVGDEASLVKGLFFEISGVSANASGNNRIDVSVDDNSFSAGREKRFTINANGRQTPFKFLYDDSTDYIDGHIANTGRGTYGPYTLNIKALDAAVSLWSVRMVITYRHKPPGQGSGVPAIGYYESPIFEATTGGESSSIKSGFNTLYWTEAKSATQRVKFQIATCDSVTGSTCNDGGGWSYKGTDGSTGTYYGYDEVGFGNYCSGSSGAYTCRISQDHNNKRYFRYKITLCSSGDCSSSGATSPKVEKVILNWSP